MNPTISFSGHSSVCIGTETPRSKTRYLFIDGNPFPEKKKHNLLFQETEGMYDGKYVLYACEDGEDFEEEGAELQRIILKGYNTERAVHEDELARLESGRIDLAKIVVHAGKAILLCEEDYEEPSSTCYLVMPGCIKKFEAFNEGSSEFMDPDRKFYLACEGYRLEHLYEKDSNTSTKIGLSHEKKLVWIWDLTKDF